MGSTSIGYQAGISARFDDRNLNLRSDATLSSLPCKVDFSRKSFLSAATSTHNKECSNRARVCSLPNTDEKLETPLLDSIETPSQLKNLTVKELKVLADEIRTELLSVLWKTRKSMKPSLAAIELTLALHYVFRAPVDKILWDAVEQTYAHKVLTRRWSSIPSRQNNGVSSVTSRLESEYDSFGTGHGCNSISAGLGLAVARDIKGKRDRVVAVIDSVTITAGQAYEAMSNAGYLDSNMIVILNDNRHSLHPNMADGSKASISALSSFMSKIQSSQIFRKFRELAKRDAETANIVVKDRRTYSDCFAEALVKEAEKDRDIVVVHAGIEMDPSLVTFQERFPERFFNVGMAEQHAVTFSAGLSSGGLKPFCIIPSAFLQRAYDQIGRGRVLLEGQDVALLGYGAMVQNCLNAHSLLSKLGLNVTVADARFCKPLDIKLVRDLCQNHKFLITVEEGCVGGFGSHVAQFIALDGQLDGKIKWRPIVLPDGYIEEASPNEQLALAGLTGHHIAATALSLLGRTREALLLMS
ncbi:hypothetical protein HID58_039357 [Brassica napus]|uniref:1-deoxy-D-xylulose-5-phosphate synthase n=1 Tax=Brassica napus TaxID=3708 RepID=A0ABQ8BRU0_BRANA|nr:hypothetical protein HID58_039357 [Brassica napus]